MLDPDLSRFVVDVTIEIVIGAGLSTVEYW